MEHPNGSTWHAPRISRRGLLLGAALAPLALGAARTEGLFAADRVGQPMRADGLRALLAQPEGRIVRGPFLEESPLHAIDGLITPTRLHFIRNHTPTPLIDPDTWKLTVDGEVDRPMELSYEDVQRLPSKSLNILLECAGNGRSHFNPRAEGTPWAEGAVSVAEWTGVPLGDLLRSAGIRPNAVHVVARGADAGQVERGLPVDVALGPNTLLAYAMNGDTLPADHGFPLRLVVPGWIGVASIKWLERLTVTPRPLEGAYQTVRYVLDGPDYPGKLPATVLPVKSVVARPYTATTIEPGLASISGFAWSGSGKITRVEVSLNGGTSWSDARVLEPIDPLHWARWDFPWDAEPGQYTLLSRATDESGAVQPRSVPWNRLGYLYHASVPVPIGVGQPAPEAGASAQAAAPASAAADQPIAGRGQEVYAQRCADCHGADGGGTPRGSRVIGPGTNVVAYSPQELDRYIRTSMPQFDPGSLSPQEYDEVIAFLRRANNLP